MIEQERNRAAEALHKSYQLVVDQTLIEDPVWPPVAVTVTVDTSRGRSVWTGWRVAAAGSLLTASFGIGWLAAPSPGAMATDPFPIQTITFTTIAIPSISTIPTVSFSNPFDALIAAAGAQDPSLIDPHVTRLIGVYADDQIVDLRAQVRADGFCHWYAVTGRVQDGALGWSAAPVSACEQ